MISKTVRAKAALAAATLLTGLTVAAPASASAAIAADVQYGCVRGNFCMYTTEVISAGTRIASTSGNWEGDGIKYVRSFFNYGSPEYYDHVAVTYRVQNATREITLCVHRAEDNNLAAGHEAISVPVTAVRVKWIHRSAPPCYES
ncbi:hypothetical protein [Nonomuraea sp. NPDC023979]|uniref:hypothetical protein n=1 Tax=Nonomuraea sp. NPDC023979 TaxID=3154796 RepID=UPI00340F818F